MTVSGINLPLAVIFLSDRRAEWKATLQRLRASEKDPEP